MDEGINLINQRDKTKKYVAIFDIDETILINDTRIEPIYMLYQYALINHIDVIFITAREWTENNVKETIDQLNRLCIKNYLNIYFRPEYITDIETYKTICRKNIVDNGYEPLFSIGDMYWDVGSFGGISLHIQ